MAKLAVNKKISHYFDVDDEKIMTIIENLKGKGLEVSMITCTNIKIAWRAGKYTIDDINKMLEVFSK